MTPALLELADVSQVFTWHKKPVRALDGVSLSIDEGETICLVGESGCGKTTTGKIVAGPAPAPPPARCCLRAAISDVDRPRLAEYRSTVQLIHQDPYASLNPSRSIADILSAPLTRHGWCATGSTPGSASASCWSWST
jgi:peptide/nickel transport system ATP-binding protein